MAWGAHYASPRTGVNVQLVTRDTTGPTDSVISAHTDGSGPGRRPCTGRQRGRRRPEYHKYDEFSAIQ